MHAQLASELSFVRKILHGYDTPANRY